MSSWSSESELPSALNDGSEFSIIVFHYDIGEMLRALGAGMGILRSRGLAESPCCCHLSVGNRFGTLFRLVGLIENYVGAVELHG